MRSLFIAITGASGSVYAKRLLELALEQGTDVSLCLSEHGAQVVAHELGEALDTRAKAYRPDDMFAPMASGSNFPDAMIIIPCSMGTAGRVAAGVSNDLITRAADVALKEHKPLVLVPRETPLSLIHLRNLTALAEAGARIVPAMPAFYTHPRSIEEIVDFIARRALASAGIQIPGGPKWEGV